MKNTVQGVKPGWIFCFVEERFEGLVLVKSQVYPVMETDLSLWTKNRIHMKLNKTTRRCKQSNLQNEATFEAT